METLGVRVAASMSALPIGLSLSTLIILLAVVAAVVASYVFYRRLSHQLED